MQGLGLGGGLYCLVMPFANQTVHNCKHFHTLSLNQTSPFFGGILSLWRQKSNRSNNIRCALTGVHWESGLVTAHASIAGYNCEAAHKCSRLRHSLARAQQLREARSITGKVTQGSLHTSTILADAGQWTSPYLKTISIKSNYTFNILRDEKVAKLQF